MASVNLSVKNSSGSTLNTYKVDCASVQIGWSNSLDTKPYANSLSLGVSEVQKNGFENPIYNLQGVIITERSGTLSYADIVSIAKQTTGSSDNYLVLDVDYGSGSTKLIDSAEASSGIKVVLKSFNFNIGLDTRYGDTNRAMTGTIVLQESA